MRRITVLSLLLAGLTSIAQEKVSIVMVIDDLTVRWDQTAIELKNYRGIHNFCDDDPYREKTIELLDQIHHWDTTLYFIVQEKFDTDKDEEAAETLRDIEKLETEYSTENFKLFIQDECAALKVIEEHFDQQTVRKFENEIKKFERESNKYINSITYRIDIIDEHIHHLKLDE